MVLNNFIKVACLSTCLGLASGSILANSNYNIDTNGGLKVYDTNNNDHWFHLSGKVQFDQNVYHNFQNNDNNPSLNHNLGGVSVDLKGGIGQNTSYQVGLKRNNSGALNVNKAQLNYSGFNEWSRVSVGHIGMPYGLESANKGSSFLERSLATSMFAPSSGFGMGLDAWTDKVGLRVAVTQPSNNTDALNTSFRLSCAPYNTDEIIFHMGLSGQFVRSAAIQKDATFTSNLSTNSEFSTRAQRVAGANAATTGDQTGSSYSVVSADAAVLRGPLFVQGEYHRSAHNGVTDAVNAEGWNVQASYAITGESRDYNYQNGSFSNISTERDSGSWEVALRHSAVRCNSQTEEKNSASTLGGSVSWVANNNITVLANYIHTPVLNAKDNLPNEGSLTLRVQAAW